MTLLDSKPVKPPRRVFKIFPIPVFVLILIVIGAVIARVYWDYPEERAVSHFLTALEQSKFQQAYQIWKPAPSYTYPDFLRDWGAQGDYGKIHNFQVVYAKSLGWHTVQVWVRIDGRLTSLLVDRQSKSLSYPLPE